MEIRNIVGHETYEYDFDGRKGSGVRLYCTVPKTQQDVKVIGQKVEVLKVSPDIFAELGSLKLGDAVEIYYNRYGKIELIKHA